MFSLPKNEIHIWSVHTKLSALVLQSLQELLSPEEKIRAYDFKFDYLQNRFIAARGILRFILSQYLDINPQQIKIGYTEKGKPFLKRSLSDPLSLKSLKFNTSHSREKVLYALTLGSEVGIDLEYMRESLLNERLEDYFLSCREKELLNILPWPFRVEAFFNAWTRKEAIVKASGEGLTSSLSDIEVVIEPGSPPKVLSINGNEELGQDWTLYALSSFPGYNTALALRGPQKRLIERDFNLVFCEESCI